MHLTKIKIIKSAESTRIIEQIGAVFPEIQLRIYVLISLTITVCYAICTDFDFYSNIILNFFFVCVCEGGFPI